MTSNILAVIALCLLSAVTAEIQLLSCTTASTGECNIIGGGCNLPSDIANCSVNWQGTSYLCTSPPAGYIYTGVTCNYMLAPSGGPGCTSCSANAFNHVQPICQWRS